MPQLINISVMSLTLHLSSGQVADRGAGGGELRDWLIARARGVEFEQQPPHRAIHGLLAIARACDTMQLDPVADEFFRRASAISERDPKGSHHFAFFEYAIDTNQPELAERIANESQSDSLLDRWDLERLRRGDRDAIRGYPRGEMSFYKAMELANVLVELGDYERAEEFVANVKITEENDPEDVAGITLENIAKRCRGQGDLENARRYIDKAKEIAGNQFYTGYAINITHRSIHGTLTEDLDPFARKGAAYRGHMGRELISLLASELVRTGHFEEAKKATGFLEKPKDVQNGLRRVAIAQAQRGDVAAALQTVDEFEDAHARDAARLGIAQVFAAAGKSDTARKLGDFVLRGLKKAADKEVEQTRQQLAYLYGRLRLKPQLERLLAETGTPLSKADCVRNAIRGYADASERGVLGVR